MIYYLGNMQYILLKAMDTITRRNMLTGMHENYIYANLYRSSLNGPISFLDIPCLHTPQTLCGSETFQDCR